MVYFMASSNKGTERPHALTSQNVLYVLVVSFFVHHLHDKSSGAVSNRLWAPATLPLRKLDSLKTPKDSAVEVCVVCNCFR